MILVELSGLFLHPLQPMKEKLLQNPAHSISYTFFPRFKIYCIRMQVRGQMIIIIIYKYDPFSQWLMHRIENGYL
jgi:hypothetical protein